MSAAPHWLPISFMSQGYMLCKLSSYIPMDQALRLPFHPSRLCSAGTAVTSTADWGLKKTDIYFFTVLEARSLEFKLWAGLVPAEASLWGV